MILNGLKINRKEKRRQQQFDSVWTYEDVKGKSVIDYSLIEIHLLDKINNVYIDDDIWQVCNTQHKSIITDLNLELTTTQKRIKKKPTSGGWEVKLNRLANKEFWKEYKINTSKRNLEPMARKISNSKEVEKS